MLYRVTFVDGSEELVEGDDIRDAKSQAKLLYDAPIKHLRVQELEGDEEDDDEGEAEDDTEEEDEEDGEDDEEDDE